MINGKIFSYFKSKKYLVGGMIGIILFFALLIFLFPGFFLDGIAERLVVNDTLERVPAIVVLTGSNSGNRIQTAAQLFQKGYADYIVFSGFKVYPGTYTHTMMKKYAVDLGIPEERIITQPAEGEVSTFGEAEAILKILLSNEINRFILVTSSFHTRRAQYVYKTLIDRRKLDMEFMVCPSEDPDVPIQGWWKTRTGQKMIFYEVTKNIYYRFAY